MIDCGDNAVEGKWLGRRFVDLHTHSVASDGTFAPAEIAALADEIGLAAVALADHDTVSGVDEFLDAGGRFPELETVPGVEISADFDNRELHIVGLFVDHRDESLLELLREIRGNRDKRNEELVGKLRALGFEISLDELMAEAGGESIGRPIVAKILVGKGYFSEPQEVFDKCLNRNGPAYCKRILPEPERAIDAIHVAGGLAIWAHPLHRAGSDRSFMRRVLRKTVPMGLDGVEAYYTKFAPEHTRAVLDVAGEFDLPVSGGSDFHGGNQIGVELGTGRGELEVPLEAFARLREIWNVRTARA
jgi:predicted metal-dependent phosphoesterase TrpH